ncbi:hypothetical protein Dimus_017942 [Dionaea muscipula]
MAMCLDKKREARTTTHTRRSTAKWRPNRRNRRQNHTVRSLEDEVGKLLAKSEIRQLTSSKRQASPLFPIGFSSLIAFLPDEFPIKVYSMRGENCHLVREMELIQMLSTWGALWPEMKREAGWLRPLPVPDTAAGVGSPPVSA